MSSKFTFIGDLKVNDEVFERHLYSEVRYRSTVKSVTSSVITVERKHNNEQVRYDANTGRIIYPPYSKISDFVLEQAVFPTKESAFNPGPVATDAQSLIEPYGGN